MGRNFCTHVFVTCWHIFRLYFNICHGQIKYYILTAEDKACLQCVFRLKLPSSVGTSKFFSQIDRNFSTDVFLHIGTFLEGALKEIQKLIFFASPYWPYLELTCLIVVCPGTLQDFNISQVDRSNFAFLQNVCLKVRFASNMTPNYLVWLE